MEKSQSGSDTTKKNKRTYRKAIAIEFPSVCIIQFDHIYQRDHKNPAFTSFLFVTLCEDYVVTGRKQKRISPQ